MTYILNGLFDPTTLRYPHVDASGKLLIAEQKRIVGQNSITNGVGEDLYTDTVGGTGSNTSSNSVSTLATGTTANSSIITRTTNRTRFQFGRINLLRSVTRFATAGTANNVRQFSLYVDANNELGFRLSDSTFSIFYKKAGSETVISNGSFNGNGQQSGRSWEVDTHFHQFEIEYYAAKIIFRIDNVAIHTLIPTTTSFISSLVGYGSFSNVNSGGSTTNVTLENMGFGCFQYGTGISNPQFYNIDAVAETRTLKGGGGTLQTVAITKSATVGTLTLYDNTTSSGVKIATFDLAAAASVGTHTFGIEGVNFTSGLTYVTSGAMTGGSATITWE